MSFTTLTVDLTDPDSLVLAEQIFELVRNGEWPNPTISGANANRNGGRAGGSASASADERAPWEEDDEKPARGSTERSSAPPDDDPWASQASGGSNGSGGSSGRSKAKCADGVPGKDFPKSGSYDKVTPSAFMVWEFDTDKAPTCDGGHTAAKITAYKGKDHAGGKPSYTSYWCPMGFGKSWKKKCDFSEWA